MKRLASLLLVCALLLPVCALASSFDMDMETFQWFLSDHMETFINWTYGGSANEIDLYYGIADRKPLLMTMTDSEGQFCGVNVTDYLPKTFDSAATEQLSELIGDIHTVVNTLNMRSNSSYDADRALDAILSPTLEQVRRDGSLSRYRNSPGEYTHSDIGMNFYQTISFSDEDDMYVYSLSIFSK